MIHKTLIAITVIAALAIFFLLSTVFPSTYICFTELLRQSSQSVVFIRVDLSPFAVTRGTDAVNANCASVTCVEALIRSGERFFFFFASKLKGNRPLRHFSSFPANRHSSTITRYAIPRSVIGGIPCRRPFRMPEVERYVKRVTR